VNDERWAEFATSVARDAGYETRHAELHMGGEDFAVYFQNIRRICQYWQRQRLVYITRHLTRTKH
jgi:metal-dependent amidase/aminoacylase/carboxypeptidase family protein